MKNAPWIPPDLQVRACAGAPGRTAVWVPGDSKTPVNSHACPHPEDQRSLFDRDLLSFLRDVPPDSQCYASWSCRLPGYQYAGQRCAWTSTRTFSLKGGMGWVQRVYFPELLWLIGERRLGNTGATWTDATGRLRRPKTDRSSSR